MGRKGCRHIAGIILERRHDRRGAGNGTTVADVILTVAPRVKLYSADVFGPAGSCEVETVIAALRHAIDVWKVKVVNLSLGVPEHKLLQLPRRQALQRAIEEARLKTENDHLRQRAGQDNQLLGKSAAIAQLQALGYSVPVSNDRQGLVFGAILAVATDVAEETAALREQVGKLKARLDEMDGRITSSFTQ